jgi:hypothetical protein
VFLILPPFEFNHLQRPIYNVWKQHLKASTDKGTFRYVRLRYEPWRQASWGGAQAHRARARKLVNFTLDLELVAQMQSIIPPGKRSQFIEHLVRCALGSRGAGS